MNSERRTVSLVLGSGGARGLAHIGVIQWLGEHDFEIRSIAGSSIGALIGGVYAAGKLDVYTEWVTTLERKDVVRLLDFSFGLSGLFRGDRIINVLKELIGDCNIEDLPISFTAIATDVHDEKEIWLNRGPLFDAIRASIAIPTVFTPYDYGGKHLLDGGLLNPIPIAPTFNDKTDLTVAVNLAAKAEAQYEAPAKEAAQKDDAGESSRRIASFTEGMPWKRAQRYRNTMSLFDIIAKSMDTMQNAIARCKLAAYSPDVVIDIPRNVCTFYEFHRGRELIDIGRRRAGLAMARFAD